MTNQNHFTLSFPLKSPGEATVVAEQLPSLMPGLFRAADTIGTIHYSRFTVLSANTLLFLGDFDGEFGSLFVELAKHAGPVFDFIFQHVESPPPTPVADHADAFVEWAAEHLLNPVNLYTAYPGMTVKEMQKPGVRRRPEWRRRAESVPGDPAHQIEPRLCRNKTPSAHEGPWDDR